MSKLKCNETGCYAREVGKWCAWIEPLDREGHGRFVWTVDIVDPSGSSVPVNVYAGVEPSLAAAGLAVEEALAHLAFTAG